MTNIICVLVTFLHLLHVLFSTHIWYCQRSMCYIYKLLYNQYCIFNNWLPLSQVGSTEAPTKDKSATGIIYINISWKFMQGKFGWHTASLCVTDLIMEVTPQFFSGTYHSSFSSTQRHLYPPYSPLFKDPLILCFIFDYCKQQLSLHYSKIFT